jgi:hypothetical protein
MALSEDTVKKFQEIYKKEHGVELSYEEAEEASNNLAGLAEILLDSYFEDQKRKKRLEESPKGFQLDGVGYTCFICGSGTQAGANWYDKWGIKCTICQAGVDRGEVPAWAAAHKDGWYSKYDLESRFGMTTPILKKWMEEGIIKARAITRESGRAHAQIFLLCDNKDFLPPKKLTESHMVKETKDGQDWFHSEPWHRFVDPFEHLKGYKIMEHMRIVPPEEMKAREEAEKKKRETRYARKKKK